MTGFRFFLCVKAYGMTRKWNLNRKKWEKVCKIGQDSKGQIVGLNYNNSNKSDTGGKKKWQ